MRYSTVARERPHLLSGWSLAVIALVGVLIFALVFPRYSTLAPQPGERGDAVSITYAELLLKSHPTDDQLRLRLIEQLLEVGNLDRAEYHLRLLTTTQATASAGFLMLELQMQRSFADPAGVSPQQRQVFVDGLAALLQQGLPPGRLRQAARLALAFEAPQLAARAFEQLARLEPDLAWRWLPEAARWYRASGDQRQTARIYQRLVAQARTAAEADRYRLEAFNAMVAGGDEAGALAELDRQLPSLVASDDTIALLRAGVRVARGRSDLVRASAYLRRWQQLRPDDELWLEQLFALTLGSGELERAWSVGQQLRARRPHDHALLRQLAQLGEWSGRPAEALPLWVQLARTTRAPADYDHAWRLAGQLFEFRQMADLLAELSTLRALQPEELRALVAAFEALAQPAVARQRLTQYLRQHPRDRAAWRMLAQVNRNERRLQDEALVWADMARRHPLTEAERVEWASLHWLLFQPQQGWNVLAAVPLAQARTYEYLTLRSNLAWALERDEDSVAALERLRALGGELSRDQTEVLLALYRRRNPEAALALAVDDWRKHGQQDGQVSRLLYALQLAMELGRHDELSRLLVQARPHHRQLRSQPIYWQALVSEVEYRGDSARLNRLLEQMLRRFPRQVWAIERYLWAQVDRRHTEGLPRRLQAWRPLARQTPSLWLPFAAAHAMLGQVRESLHWYDRHSRANPRDWAAQAAYADMLQLAGRDDSAWRLRRHVLAAWRREAADPRALKPEQFATYIRLLAGVAGAQQARLASAQAVRTSDPLPLPLLELWFERWLAQLEQQNSPGLTESWVDWARRRGLRSDDNVRLQSDLRAYRRTELERWLAQDGLPPDSRAAIYLRLGLDRQALTETLSELSPERAIDQQRTLRNQAQGVLERLPEGIRISGGSRDYGGLRQTGAELLWGGGFDNNHVEVALGDWRYSDSAELDTGRLGTEQSVALMAMHPVADGAWTGRAEASRNDVDARQGLGVERSWQLGHGDTLAAGAQWRLQNEDTGLMRALGARDSVYGSGRHRVSARDQIDWRVGLNHFTLAEGDALGDGWQAALDWSHNLLAHEPQWTVRTGVSWQENQLEDALPAGMLVSEGGVLVDGATVETVLPERFGMVYVASTWARGIPGALNRFWPQFTYKVEVRTGWQWPDERMTWALEAGAGVEVFGDDELSLLGGYNSAPVGGDGQSGGLIRLNYSLRFGR